MTCLHHAVSKWSEVWICLKWVRSHDDARGKARPRPRHLTADAQFSINVLYRCCIHIFYKHSEGRNFRNFNALGGICTAELESGHAVGVYTHPEFVNNYDFVTFVIQGAVMVGRFLLKRVIIITALYSETGRQGWQRFRALINPRLSSHRDPKINNLKKLKIQTQRWNNSTLKGEKHSNNYIINHHIEFLLTIVTNPDL